MEGCLLLWSENFFINLILIYKKQFQLVPNVHILPEKKLETFSFIYHNVSKNILKIIHCRHTNFFRFQNTHFFITIFLHINIWPRITQKFINVFFGKILTWIHYNKPWNKHNKILISNHRTAKKKINKNNHSKCVCLWTTIVTLFVFKLMLPSTCLLYTSYLPYSSSSNLYK